MPWVISSSAANTLESMPSLINEEHAGTSGISTFPASVLADEVEPNTDEEHAAVSSTSTFPSSVPANEGKASVTEEIHADLNDPTPSTPALPQSPMWRRSREFRNIDNFHLSNSTPRKKKLVDILRRKEDQLRKVKALCRKRSAAVSDILDISNERVVKNIFKDVPSLTANLMVSQIRNYKVKNVKGRRWSLEDKILALSLFKRSPRCYNLLRKFASLPCKNTILNLLKKVPFKVGINQNIFDQIDQNLPQGKERCCVLLFDEMDIKEAVQYDSKQQPHLGYLDLT
ncbi:uncharacterized protein LOC123317715 [Coccinella septempunctata]|uniref:uncharacterized protein LOC123317715 n=1 Tax=Coccinella septempunctata TaxID=41139 RepID=UPI001D05F597|nr:uncharacterized protein LOC123317715 [Coccinella septempunctata]